MRVTRASASDNERPRRRRHSPSAVDLMNAAQGLLFAAAAFLATADSLIQTFIR
jgi:hypothetical protein